jgi:hypothetical protein
MYDELFAELRRMNREIQNFKLFEVSRPPIYGSMYGDDISVSVVISVAGNYYPVNSGISGGACSHMVFQNAREIKCQIAGKYKADRSLTVKIVSGANSHIEGAVMINSTEQLNTVNTTHLQNSNDEQSVGGTGIITLAVGDVVKLCIENETDTSNVIVDHVNMTLVRLGG